MFLTKKNASYFNKPKPGEPVKHKRALAGWDDEPEQKQQSYKYASKNEFQPQTATVPNLLSGQPSSPVPIVSPSVQSQQKFYFTWDELDARTDIECEKKVVEEVVQPGGIRIKPNDNVLNQFGKEVKGMEIPIIGSLLLSKIEVNYPFLVKAKALYAIQFLVKKNQKYLGYFKAHSDKLSEFPEPQDSVQNYRKILKSVLSMIGINNAASSKSVEEPKPVYVDPGYYTEEPKPMGQFIKENEGKKAKGESKRAIIGPGQLKNKAATTANNADVLGLDLLGGSLQPKQATGEFNLLDVDLNPKQPTLTFDQLLASSASSTNPPSNAGGFSYL